MTTPLKTKGTSLDTRLRNSLLLDARLQRRLTAEEFRAFVNLKVWVVSLLSDGFFDPDEAEMIPNLDRRHIDRMTEVGVVEHDDIGNYRIDPEYWSWQSSRAELAKMEQKRDKDRERQARYRTDTKGETE